MSNVYWTTQNEINSTSVTPMSDMFFHNIIGAEENHKNKYPTCKIFIYIQLRLNNSEKPPLGTDLYQAGCIQGVEEAPVKDRADKK